VGADFKSLFQDQVKVLAARTERKCELTRDLINFFAKHVREEVGVRPDPDGRRGQANPPSRSFPPENRRASSNNMPTRWRSCTSGRTIAGGACPRRS
jgi:hypothetical protein